MSKPEPEEEEKKKERMDKKRKLKEMFDAEYDEGDATYFDDLKEEMHKQAQVQAVNLAIYLALHLQKYPTAFARSFLPGDMHDIQELLQKVHRKKYMLVFCCCWVLLFGFFFLWLKFFIPLAGKKNKPNN